MEQTVYFDNSSTTMPCNTAIKYVSASLTESWGNPSSLHSLGVAAEAMVTAAREKAALLLHCRADEVYFTGSGTEANNTVLFGAAQRGKKRGNRIVTTAIEHPSVLRCLEKLEKSGFEIVYLKPDSAGHIATEQLRDAVNKDTILVSMMLVNNEIGSILPVKEAGRIIRESGAPALLHCDAVQAFGKLPINVNELGVDFMTASGHKIHAPKGVGLMYIKRGVVCPPLLVGGGQERGMRSGTEPVPAICGLYGALEELPEPRTMLKKMTELRNFAAEKLSSTGIVEINSADDSLPYILNISVPGYRSEILLHFLEARGIFVSSGSACSRGAGSYVLNACGLSRGRIDSALRLSFSRYNSEEEIKILCDALKSAALRLRKGNL